MSANWEEEVQKFNETYKEFLKEKERMRKAMEHAYMDYEVLELKYKKILKENEELSQKLLTAEQIIKERKWSEWKVNEEIKWD